MKTKNPIVTSILDKFVTVYEMTKIFSISNRSAIRGLLVSGDAGTGKTHWVRKALAETTEEHNICYLKGASITAPMIYVKMFLHRKPGQILVLDDVDLIHKSRNEMSAILDLFKGAIDTDKDEHMVGWVKAGANTAMKDHGVPTQFDFQGSVIWITNDSIADIRKKTKGHWEALDSRFNSVTVYLNQQEKVLYTLHLIEEGLLGPDCQAKEGGYSDEIIERTAAYISENYKDLGSVTPRLAVKIADTMENHPEHWKMMCEQQYARA